MKRTHSIALVFGMAAATLGAVPAITPAAVAQAVSMSAEEQALQSQIIALAQAGNTAALQQFIGQKIAQGKAGLVAKVAKNIAAIGQSMSTSDTRNAVALLTAAMLIASNPTVSTADPTVGTAVGQAAGSAAATISSFDPESAARIQSAAASIGSQQVVAGFSSGGSNDTPTQTVGGGGGGTGGTVQVTTQTTTRTSMTQVVVPPRPDTPEGPVVVEPAPSQHATPT